MADAHSRIVVALNRRHIDVLTRKVKEGAIADIATLRDAAVALEDDGKPLKAILERDQYKNVSITVPNKTHSVKDQLALEATYRRAPARSLVGIFSLNASSLPPQLAERLVHDLRSVPDVVESASIEHSNPVRATGTASFRDRQTYLNAAPQGIGLPEGSGDRTPAGTGVGLGVIDMGWNLRHEALVGVAPDHIVPRTHGSDTDKAHGTSALAIILCPPGRRITGIAPSAELRALKSPAESETSGDFVADAINDVVKELQEGDVLLLEIGEGDRPVEVNTLSWVAIAQAADNGVIVIEPAGNGTWDLEALARDKKNAPAWEWHGDASTQIPDSGAIIVSGCTSGQEHHRKGNCNHGDRVDCYAYGENVVAAGDVALSAVPLNNTNNENAWYRTDFDGTSSASAIIAGVVLRMQALARQTLNRSLNAFEIRALLRSPKMGTPITADGKSWYMPDLAKLPNVLEEFAHQTKPAPYLLATVPVTVSQ